MGGASSKSRVRVNFSGEEVTIERRAHVSREQPIVSLDDGRAVFFDSNDRRRGTAGGYYVKPAAEGVARLADEGKRVVEMTREELEERALVDDPQFGRWLCSPEGRATDLDEVRVLREKRKNVRLLYVRPHGRATARGVIGGGKGPAKKRVYFLAGPRPLRKRAPLNRPASNAPGLASVRSSGSASGLLGEGLHERPDLASVRSMVSSVSSWRGAGTDLSQLSVDDGSKKRKGVSNCCVCEEALDGPWQSKCGHVCCQQCWSNYLSENKNVCPECEARVFVEELKKVYLCAICLCVVHDSRKARCCGVRCCLGCWNNWIRESKAGPPECPNDSCDKTVTESDLVK